MSKENGNAFIEGDKIDLVPLNSDHIKLYVKWQNHSEVRKFTRNEFPSTIEMFKKQFESKGRSLTNEIRFEIYHKEDQKAVGLAGISNIHYAYRKANIAVNIGDLKYWGKGIASEAGKLLIDYGFGELNLYKITSTIYSPNVGSWKVAEKLGMEREATLKNNGFIDGEYVNDYCYCIFQDDWIKNKGK
ncbi:MAG: GNAT family N-acetyltransferase [Promethearchaeota archaeon]